MPRLIEMYALMRKIRLFEQEVKQLYRAGRIKGALHLYIGQEAIAVGVCANLRDDDCVTSTHRGHGHMIAKGCGLDAIMAELMGKATGCSRGHGGSMHLFAPRIGFLGGNGIVGGGIPIALGAAFAAKYRGSDGVAVTFFGEGASNQGTFHETLNLASLWKLPLIAVCENNCYAATTPAAKSTAVGDVATRAQGYGIPGVIVDGNDCAAVLKAAAIAVDRARQGQGPTLLECKTYRVEPHCGIIAEQRPKGEKESWQRDFDPIKRLLAQLPRADMARVADIDSRIVEEINQAVAFAEASPQPEVGEMTVEFAGL